MELPGYNDIPAGLLAAELAIGMRQTDRDLIGLISGKLPVSVYVPVGITQILFSIDVKNYFAHALLDLNFGAVPLGNTRSRNDFSCYRR